MATKLKRDLGLLETTFIGIGIILGAGIYVLIGAAAGIAGNAVWASFAIGAVVAAFTGLSYAELSSMFSKDSGEYIYAKEAFTDHVGFVVAWLIALTGIIGAAAVSLGFAGYFIPLLSLTINPIWIAALIILLLSLLNFWGIKQAAWTNIIFTLLEAGGLVFIVLIGLPHIGKVNYLESPGGFPSVLSAAALIFFAYIGFESIVKMSEETKNPKKIIPQALILSLIVSTVLYILVAISAVSVLGWEKLATSSAPLADVAAVVFGSNAFLVLSIIALFSTGNTVLILLMSTSRLIYGVCGYYPRTKYFSGINKTRKTPARAIFLVMIVTFAFSLIGDISFIAEMTNFAVFSTFAIINASMMGLRYKSPRRRRPFKSPLNVGKFSVTALLGFLVSLFMLINLSRNIIYGGTVTLLIGFVFYWLVRGKKDIC